MNILISGIHGFVGSNLVAALKDHHLIYGLDIVSPAKEGVIKTFGWTEMGLIEQTDAVIHLAGKAHDTKNHTREQVYYDINTGLTRLIFDWFLTSGAKTFVFFSSVKAVADKVELDFLTEEVIPDPKGPYGKSKLAAEDYIRQHEMAGKAVYILRPCMIHGPGNKGNLNLLYALQKNGFPWPLGAFDNKRSFTSVENLLFVIGRLLDQDIEPGTYNVADDEQVSTNELIRLMAESLNKKPRIWHIPPKVIHLAANLGDRLKLPLNSERLRKLTESYVVSNARLKAALGVTTMPVTAQDGLALTLASFNHT